jgi:hypothetical protein
MVGVDFDASVSLLMYTEESISLGINGLSSSRHQLIMSVHSFFICEQGVMTFVPNVPATYKHVLMAFLKVSKPGVIPSSATSLLRTLKPPDLLNRYGCHFGSRDQKGPPGGLWLVDRTWGLCDGKVQRDMVQRPRQSLWYTVSNVEKDVFNPFLC